MDRYNHSILTLLHQQKDNPHPRTLLFLNHFNCITNQQLYPLINRCLESWITRLKHYSHEDTLPYSSIYFAYEYKKLSKLVNYPLSSLELETHLIYAPKQLQSHLNEVLKPENIRTIISTANLLTHPLLKKILHLTHVCWSYIELGEHLQLPSSFIYPFKLILTKLDPLNSHIYTLLINDADSSTHYFPTTCTQTFSYANALKDALGIHQNDIIMIGVALLDNGEFLASFSAQSSTSAQSILYSLLPTFKHLIPSIPVAHTRYFHRYIRLKDTIIKFHNGFSCVEPKLIQSALLLGRKISSMSIIRTHETGKRYDTSHTPTLSNSCPGCLLNFHTFKLFN